MLRSLSSLDEKDSYEELRKMYEYPSRTLVCTCVLRELIRLQFRKDSHRGLDKTLPPWRDKVTNVCIRGNQGESKGIKIYYRSDQKTGQKSWLSLARGRDTRKISKVGPQAP
jgi:hypothetical protein